MTRWQRLRKHLQQPYRLTILHAETYEQHGEYVVRVGWVYALIGGAALLLVALTTTLIFYTPIRELIPGYTDTELKRRQELLLLKVEEMENKIAQRDSVIQSMLRVTNVDTPTSRPAAAGAAPKPVGSPAPEAEAMPEPYRGPKVRFAANSQTPPFRFVRPLETGFLTNTFRPAEQHFAIDLAGPAKELVRAVADGYVIFSDYTTETGHVVGIHHPQQFVSFYKHNRTNFKKTGDFVKAGEPIAVIGNSGENSTGPHLHFELWHQGQPVDPLLYLNYHRY
jgi:murein DD-endopeptidase MepM/ murein hydrolase activator NlpD